MDFTIPTTKSEMYSTLKELFMHYRIYRYGYDQVKLNKITLEKQEFIPLTSEKRMEKSQILLGGEHLREISERKLKLLNEIEEKNAIYLKLDENFNVDKKNIIELYENSKKAIEKKIRENKTINSSFVIDKILSLEKEKNEKIIELSEKLQKERSRLSASIANLQNQLQGVEDYFAPIHQKDLDAKAEKIKDEEEKFRQEVFKYNSQISEKEAKYENSIIQSQANLELKFMELRSGEFTKSELIEMGYYADCLKCVAGYYDTVSASTVYTDFINEVELIPYLDDFYQDLAYAYKQKQLEALNG